MSDPLGTYLDDHLAGATFAVEMLDALKDASRSEKIGRAAQLLWREVDDDRAVLRTLVERVSGNSGTLKEAASWIAEKVARLKLRHTSADAFGTFETLEALALGILGKEHLWRALSIAAVRDSRIQGPDYGHLASRALSQHAIVEQLRLDLAREIFPSAAGH